MFKKILAILSVMALAAFCFDSATQASPINTLIIVNDSTALQIALNTILDGSIIELQTGTYNAPTGGFTLNIPESTHSFTMRAAIGSTVLLSGETKHKILKYTNTDNTNKKLITFERLSFTGGSSDIGGAIYLEGVDFVCLSCKFHNNNSSDKGGAVAVVNSTALFIDTNWELNSATNFGGALDGNMGGSIYLYRNTFSNNSVAKPEHLQHASGGAVHLGNVDGYIGNSTFQNNSAGYAGGAIYSIADFTSNQRELVVTNSVFSSNIAKAYASAGISTESGAIHIEANVTAKIFSSQFISNQADAGGAINGYRAILEIENSTFLYNKTTSIQNGQGGGGGAISSVSNDNDIDNNDERAAQLTILNSYFQGSDTGTDATSGGCVFANGDMVRQHGLAGIVRHDNLAGNRTVVNITNSIFNHCSAGIPALVDSNGQTVSNATNKPGGAIFAHLVDITIDNTLFVNNASSIADTSNATGRGGAIEIIDNSKINIKNSTFANNTAYDWGGAISIYGSEFDVTNNKFIFNNIAGLTANYDQLTYNGSALMVNEQDALEPGSTKYAANGKFDGNLIVDGNGKEIAIYRANATISSITKNQFYKQGGSSSTPVLLSWVPWGSKTITYLNSNLLDNTQFNTLLQTQPNECTAKIAPLYLTTANPTAYAGFAWSADSANVTITGAAALSNLNTYVSAVPNNTTQTLQIAAATPVTCQAQAQTAVIESNFSFSSGQINWSASATNPPLKTLLWTPNDLQEVAATGSMAMNNDQASNNYLLQIFSNGAMLKLVSVSATIKSIYLPIIQH